MRLSHPNVRLLWFAAATTALFAQNLPDGAGKDVVERACGICHPATIVMGRNMNRDQWSAQVTRMVEEGAKLTDAEFTQAVDYLFKAFPSGPTAAVPPPVRGSAIYTANCGNCHERQKGPDLVRSVIVLRDRFGKEIGPFLKKGHPMQSGRRSDSLTEAEIADLSHFLHQKVTDTLRSGPH